MSVGNSYNCDFRLIQHSIIPKKQTLHTNKNTRKLESVIHMSALFKDDSWGSWIKKKKKKCVR